MKVLKLLVLVGSLFIIQAVIAEVVSDEAANAADKSAPKSLHQDNNDTNLWFEAIEGDHTVYWEFIEAYDTVKESLINVAKRVACYVADLRVGRKISKVDNCFKPILTSKSSDSKNLYHQDSNCTPSEYPLVSSA